MSSTRAGHCGKKAHVANKEEEIAKGGTTPSLEPPIAHPSEEEGLAISTPLASSGLVTAGGSTQQDGNPSETGATPPQRPCHGFGWNTTDKEKNWEELHKAYLYFIEGGPKASTKLTVEKFGGAFVAKAPDCTGVANTSSWQHGVQCCKPCHLARTDPNGVAKKAILGADKIIYAIYLLGKPSLTKSDMSYLQHGIVERPATSGNEAFSRLRDAVKIRMMLQGAAQQMPEELRGTSGETLFELVIDVYNKGMAPALENSVVHHMMLNLLQKLVGQPSPAISAKLFAFGRVLRHLHKPSYDFFRLNAGVGPHVETIRKMEANTFKDNQELIIQRTAEGSQIGSFMEPLMTGICK